MTILERLSAETEQATFWRNAFRKTLDLLLQIKAGKVNPASVVVDIDDEKWSINAPAMVPDAIAERSEIIVLHPNNGQV